MFELPQEEVGNRIRRIRNKNNLDQKEFSKKIGTTVSSLSNWENGRNYPKFTYIERICDAFEYPTSYLTLDTRKHIKNLMERLERDVEVDNRYKILYDLDFKFNLIDEITTWLEAEPADHIPPDSVILERIVNRIYEEDKILKYLPLTNKNTIWFTTEQLRHLTYDIVRILKNNQADDDLINDIEGLLIQTRFDLDELSNDYDAD